jgi:REP element-mobilizing transposase RayT
MARPARNESSGGLYHVVARGIAKRALFRDDVDRATYLTQLARVARDLNWRCLGYCLMDNHIHLIIEIDEPTLGRGMRRLHSAYATAFNVRYDLSGYVFQGRYRATRIDTDEQLVAVIAYVARNPVEAGVVRAPEDWPWSSHRGLLEGRAPTWIAASTLMGYLESIAGGDPLVTYRKIVTEGVRATEAV